MLKRLLFLCISVVFSSADSGEIDKREITFSGKVIFIGDSHKTHFDKMPNITPIIITPPCLEPREPLQAMYTIGRNQGTAVFSVLNVDEIQDGDALFFSFGWLDANFLIWKQINIKHREVEEIIENLVNSYMNVICGFTDKKTIKIVYNLTPPAIEARPGPDPQYRLSTEDRVLYTKLINEALIKECSARQVEFFSIYDHYCDITGALLREKSDGDHHIHRDHHQLIYEELWKLLSKYM